MYGLSNILLYGLYCYTSSGPFGTFKAPISMPPGPQDSVVWLVLYMPSMSLQLFWHCGECAVWDTISSSSLVKTDAEDLMSLFPVTFLSLSTPFILLLENDPANLLAVFHFSKFYEHLSLTMSICCKIILKLFLHALNFLFAFGCPVLWLLLFSFSSSSLS